jgi:hypothetical protein
MYYIQCRMVMEAEIVAEEISVGDLVSFGRPESRKDPAYGEVIKVNRQTYTIRLVTTWYQVKRTYSPGSQFRVSKSMVSRYMADSELI